MSNILNTTSRTHRFASSRIQPGVTALFNDDLPGTM